MIQTKETVVRPQQRLQSRPPLSRDMAAAGRTGRSSNSAARNRWAAPVEVGNTQKGSYGQREMLRRALTPTPSRQRAGLRRWNFRPTPSRLSTMSMA
ncbi:hypothetical protein SAY87_031705 [Trapa incisa]|uniref:Uncharacterized protein n=2 Tax=Trapa TaxID=22665 RepID=A0AAN7M1H6_TRANT|nr:hypothetical protein SAY87_031705 [Trapa incisa]KAK4797276.1 hypothetical protein SAY86_029602 [Trapa natans]